MEILKIQNDKDIGNELYAVLKNNLYQQKDKIKLGDNNPYKHPYFYKAFVALADNNPVAHAALYNNPFLIYQNKKATCIGNYECIEDSEISKAFLQQLIYVTRQTDAKYLIGPMNGSTWDNYRFCDAPNAETFFLEPFNKQYYTKQFEEAGFEKMAQYFSAINIDLNYKNLVLEKRENELIEQGVVFRNINLDNYENELKKIYYLCLESFADNFLYTPISWQDFRSKYFSALPYIDKDFVLLAEDSAAELAGFIFCLADIFNQEKKQLIIKTVARKKGRNYRGLGDILGSKMTSLAKEKGYKGVIHALMFSENNSMAISRKHSDKIIQTYSLYAAKL